MKLPKRRVEDAQAFKLERRRLELRLELKSLSCPSVTAKMPKLRRLELKLELKS